jgi:hypothetical protein
MKNKNLRIYDDFDGLFLPDPKIYCTYCWMVHYGCRPCGPDAWRYLDNEADYSAYVQQYLANGKKHMPLGQESKEEMKQLRMGI